MKRPPSPLAGLECPKCSAILSETDASLDNVGICAACDSVLELCADRSLRIVAPDELTALDIAVRGALVQQHLEVVRSAHYAGRLPRSRFKH